MKGRAGGEVSPVASFFVSKLGFPLADAYFRKELPRLTHEHTLDELGQVGVR